MDKSNFGRQMNNSYSVRLASNGDAKRLGELHKTEIATGFLSTLGTKFLALLYDHMIDNGVVYVAQDDLNGGTPIGFISCVESTKRFYVSFLFRRGFRALPFLFSSILSVKFICKMFESLLAPFKSHATSKSEPAVDCPELLSIVVSGDSKRHGLGFALLKSLETALIQKGFTQYKVVAGGSLTSANNFYLKNGFDFVSKIVIHKGEESNIYIKQLKQIASN